MIPGKPTPSPNDEPTPLPQPPTPSPEPRPTQVPIPRLADRSEVWIFGLANCGVTNAICARHLQRLREEQLVTRRILDRAAIALFDSALILTNGRDRAMIGKPLHPAKGGE
jgi:hypothetical protein